MTDLLADTGVAIKFLKETASHITAGRYLDAKASLDEAYKVLIVEQASAESGRYSFDDMSIGWAKDNKKIDRKLVSRPPKLTSDAWYRFAGEIVGILNVSQINSSVPDVSALGQRPHE